MNLLVHNGIRMSAPPTNARLFFLCILSILFTTSSSDVPQGVDISTWRPLKKDQCPGNDTSGSLSFQPYSDDAYRHRKLCNWSLPTLVALQSKSVNFRCCASGYRSLAWKFADSKTPSTFVSLLPRETDNEPYLFLNRAFYKKFDGVYRCLISNSSTGPRLAYDQRLVSLRWKDKGSEGRATLDSSCPSNDAEFDANKQGRKDVICRVDWNILSASPVSLVVEATISNSVLVNCTFFPICDAVAWEVEERLDRRCVVDKARFPGHFNFSVALTPKVEFHVDVYRLDRKEKFRISVRAGNEVDQRSFTIRPVSSRDANAYLIFFCSLITVLVIGSAVTAVFFHRDVRLAAHRQLFDYDQPVVARACPLLVLYDHSRSGSDWTGERLFDYLRDEVGDRFAVCSEHLPGANVAGGLTRVAVCVVVVDGRSLLNEPFAGHMKRLLLERDSQRVYVLLEPFPQMRRRILTEMGDHPLCAAGVDVRKVLDLLDRIRLDTRHREVLRLSLLQKVGVQRPTWWVFRQVRLSIELIRYQITRLRAGAAAYVV